MNEYVINSEYNLTNNGENNIILTPDMGKVYILQEVETVILECFKVPISIDLAVANIQNKFSASSFDRNECINFINQLIETGILVKL